MIETPAPTTAPVAVEEESMAFRELTMIDVKEVLRRWTAGQSDRKIAREALVDRKTAARYTAVAASLFERGRELTDDEVHEVAQRVQARPVPPTSTEWNEVARHRPLVERWLAGRFRNSTAPPYQDPHAARAWSRSPCEL